MILLIIGINMILSLLSPEITLHRFIVNTLDRNMIYRMLSCPILNLKQDRWVYAWAEKPCGG